jgi:hypothetical protein
MKSIFFCGLLVFVLSVTAYCGQQSKIELNDGSMIEADILALENGVYTVNSAGLGQLKIDMSKIRSIKTQGLNTPNVVGSSQGAIDVSALPSQDEMRSEVDRVKSKIISDPDTMKNVNALLMDPQFQEMLKDPEIVNAAKNQDFKALMQNQKFLSIMGNQKMQEIEKKVNDRNN